MDMQLTADNLRRAGGAVGILFIVIGLFGFFLPGQVPKADEVAKITGFLTDKRGSILAANYLTCLAFAFFLLFVGALRAFLGASDPTGLRVGSAMLAGAVVATTFVMAGSAVINGAVFQVAGAGDANLNHALYDVANDLFFASAFGFAVFFAGAAVAIAVTDGLPSAMAPAAGALAVLNAVGGVGFFARSGFFAIGGAYGFIVPTLSLIWILWASIVMLLTRPARRAATP
jgi:hypothetical protein